MEKHLKRLQKLVGPKMVISLESGEFVIKPSDIRATFNLTEKDLKLSDKRLVENVLNPIIRNLLGCLDAERPYAENAHQTFMRQARSFPNLSAIPK